MIAKNNPTSIIKLEKSEIDEISWEGKPMPKGASRSDEIYYHMVRSLYGYVRSGSAPIADIKAKKRLLAHYYEHIETLALSSGKLICELDKLTAPMAELEAKSREELLGIIMKMQALCSGLISQAGENVPEFLRR
jgi:hypothetical protein